MPPDTQTHTCSKEFCGKNSKPNMSNIPMKRWSSAVWKARHLRHGEESRTKCHDQIARKRARVDLANEPVEQETIGSFGKGVA